MSVTTASILRIESVHAEPERLGRTRLYVRRFMRNRAAFAGLLIFALFVLISLFGGFLSPYNYATPDFLALTQPPSAAHLFGTTSGGNDVLAQVIHGMQRSLTIAICVSLATVILSAVIGAGAAYLRGTVEKVSLGLIHFLLVVPSFLILALIANSVAGDWRVLIVVLSAFGWVGAARVIWSVSTTLREREYVVMAELMGVGRWRIIVRHLIPNLASLLIVNATLGVVGTVLTETSLSFLGFGIKVPDVSLGVLLQEGSSSLTTAPWIFFFPAAVLVLLTVSVTLIGDGLRDAFDPTSAARGRR
ncbi:peptide/nickel transport system permease protein [Propionibacterium cyclohexanicum]|uniref:Oligopeptide transport system permease protein OppC n=1 Tax=Propionibacterium cyclohexanicum TaxID=64702 RepID=A0A1H9PYZ8_9ACTN|nr:ABC transporter permease [Propionibacterium cyclohexanicum]SER53447.1 peptide/nickel transport system permease protein [Propionibacterium cyclohexanicum]